MAWKHKSSSVLIVLKVLGEILLCNAMLAVDKDAQRQAWP